MAIGDKHLVLYFFIFYFTSKCNFFFCGHSKVRARHFASHDIKERLEELRSLHEEMMAEAERQGKLLQGALSIYTFLSEASLPFEFLFSIFGYHFQKVSVH